jgi:DNA replication protein DnaC
MVPQSLNGQSSVTSTDDSACRICRDAGFVRLNLPVGDPDFGKIEPCPACGPARRAQQEAKLSARISAECGLSDIQRSLSFENYRVYDNLIVDGKKYSSRKAWAEAKAYSQSGIELKQWLVLAGAPGTGKTHLMAAIANAMIARGVPVLYAYVPDLLDHWRAGYSRRPDDEEEDEYGSFDERFERTKTVALLLLDDLGAQKKSDWTVEKLESLIDYRYREGLPLVCTTNDDPTSVRDLSERIYSRIRRYVPSVVMKNTAVPWEDVRSQFKGKGKARDTEEIPF